MLESVDVLGVIRHIRHHAPEEHIIETRKLIMNMDKDVAGVQVQLCLVGEAFVCAQDGRLEKICFDKIRVDVRTGYLLGEKSVGKDFVLDFQREGFQRQPVRPRSGVLICAVLHVAIMARRFGFVHSVCLTSGKQQAMFGSHKHLFPTVSRGWKKSERSRAC